MALLLRPVRPADEDQVRAAHQEMKQSDNFEFALGLDEASSFDDFILKHAGFARGLDLPDGFVPATFLVAADDGAIVGRLSIRHVLNEFLNREGGHIGYGVLPEHRRKGYATEILDQGLVISASLGIVDALLVCNEDNVGSATVIERRGGTLLNTITGSDGERIRRYEIGLEQR